MPRWRKNESNANERRVTLYLYDDDGQPLEPTVSLVAGTDYWADRGDLTYQTPLGTLTPTTRPLVVPDQVVTFTNATDLLNWTAHTLLNGDGPLFLSGTVPTGLTVGVGYYAIYNDANSVKLASTRANALAGTAINITTDGTGTITLSDSATTARVNKGSYTYEATQAETNIDASYFALGFWKTGVRPLIMNVDIRPYEIDEVIEDSYTLAQCIRLQNGVLCGDVTNFLTGTQIYKSLNGAKIRITETTDATGRLGHVIGDLT